MAKKVDTLIKLAERINNKELRKKVISLIKNPGPKHKGFGKGVKLEDAPASESWHHTEEGGLILHIESVTKMAIELAKVYQKQYKIELDMDALIAASLCHDLMKVAELEDVGGVMVMKTPLYLDHLTLGVAELYARGFPPKVIHMIAAHHGEGGPVQPSETEAVILHFADSIDAYANTENTVRLSSVDLVRILGAQGEKA